MFTSILDDYSSKSLATLSMEGAEINAYDKVNKMLYVVSGGTKLYTVNLADPANPVLGTALELNATAQSVAVNGGYIAIALSNSTDKTQNGTVAIYSTGTNPSLITSWMIFHMF